ncbi:MAG TPA: tetratricopeptide repeat protein [Candidatus Acidoferrum sp.]|nr:tetratricopeptide repeat protein [Candidatus Acidoferrum sp.]
MDRLAVLRQFVAKSPAEPFARYGLGMELVSRGELEEACQVFQDLVDKNPDYVATYLMYGNALAATGQKERAAEMYRRGAEVSARRGDSHTANENSAALAALEGSD